MLSLICDSTELASALAEAPDVIVIGGFLISKEAEPELLRRVRSIKAELVGNPSVPMKWNVKDLKRALTVHGLLELEGKLKDVANPLREGLLKTLDGLDVALFCSIIQGYSNKKQVLGKTKTDLVTYSYGNLLMRAGLYQQNHHKDVPTECVLDWPEGSERSPFIGEHRRGWEEGKSGEVSYYCGPLRELGFLPSPVFGVTDLDPRLQIADLVVGITRAFVGYAFDKTPVTDFGVQQFKRMLKAFGAVDGKRFGIGITAAPANSGFSTQIYEAYKGLC